MATPPLSREYVKTWLAHHGDGPYECGQCGEIIEKLGGRTRGTGVVHHKDENRSNNDISNLDVMHRECHIRHHNSWGSRRHTEETKKKISEAQRKRLADPEARQRLIEGRRGKSTGPRSPETREKMRKAALEREARKRQARNGDQ